MGEEEVDANLSTGEARKKEERERERGDKSVERVERESEDENAGLRSGGECWLVGMSNYSL